MDTVGPMKVYCDMTTEEGNRQNFCSYQVVRTCKTYIAELYTYRLVRTVINMRKVGVQSRYNKLMSPLLETTLTFFILLFVTLVLKLGHKTNPYSGIGAKTPEIKVSPPRQKDQNKIKIRDRCLKDKVNKLANIVINKISLESI